METPWACWLTPWCRNTRPSSTIATCGSACRPKGATRPWKKFSAWSSIDEAAHYGLFKSFFELFLKLDRESAIAALRPVLNQFQMPAIHDLLDESAKRIARVRDLEIFNEEIFFRDVYGHLQNVLDISRDEMRGRKPKKSLVT